MRNFNRRTLFPILMLCLLLALLPAAVQAEGGNADGSVDVSDRVEFNKKDTYPYNGQPVDFNFTCDDIKEWSVLYFDANGYNLEDTPIGPGKFTVEFIGYGDNCHAEISHTYHIVQEKIEYTASDYYGEFDKQPHSITLNITTPGVTVTYSTSQDGEYSTENPTFTDAGIYTVYYKLEKAYCETETGSATVTITKADVSDRVTFNKQDAYACSGDPVAFNPVCDGITSWSFTYYDKSGAKLSAAPSKPGSYRVEMSGEGANCYARVTHAYSISDSIDPDSYSVESYSGEYDGQPHSIRLSFDPDVLTTKYSSDSGLNWQNNKPEFTNVGSYTVHVRVMKDSEIVWEDSATVTITKCTPQLYFTKESVVLQDDQDKCQLEWVYTGDGILRFGSSDDHAVWVDDNGVVYRKRSNCGTSIYCKASETKNCKSVTAMCNVEHGISYIYYDPMNHKPIIENLDITTKANLEKKVEVLKSELNLESPPVLYIDAKLIDPSDPLKKKELHNVRVNFTVPYEKILKEASPAQLEVPLSACDFTVLHQRIDNEIEQVPFLHVDMGLKICDTTLSPFAIVAYPKQYYNLYYDVNGGTGTPMIQRKLMFEANQSTRVSTTRPTREGYSFRGWSLSRGGEVQYAPGDAITLDKDILLYAVWDAVDLPKTGDDSQMELWLALMLVCALACIPLLRRKDA